jgi:ribosome biogenesis SPOUT family RNA methylase Rps3
MTTDTAVRTTRIVVQDGIKLEDIRYVDHPEIKVDEHESTEMPFRYVLDEAGNPIFPDVCALCCDMPSSGLTNISTGHD